MNVRWHNTAYNNCIEDETYEKWAMKRFHFLPGELKKYIHRIDESSTRP